MQRRQQWRTSRHHMRVICLTDYKQLVTVSISKRMCPTLSDQFDCVERTLDRHWRSHWEQRTKSRTHLLHNNSPDLVRSSTVTAAAAAGRSHFHRNQHYRSAPCYRSGEDCDDRARRLKRIFLERCLSLHG